MTETALVPAKPRPEKPRPPALRGEQVPTPIEKAAMILTAIGPEQAAGFLRDLAEADMERFARAINGLGKISQEVLDAVIVEFLELLTSGPELSGGSKAARKLLAVGGGTKNHVWSPAKEPSQAARISQRIAR